MQSIMIFQFQNFPYLGMAYLAGAITTAGHRFKLILAQDKTEGEILAAIDKFNPNFLGFTCMTGIHKQALKLARKLKAKGVTIPTIFGGPHPTLFYRHLITEEAVDIICIGEGEQSLVSLLTAVDDLKKDYTTIPGFCFKSADGALQEPVSLAELPELDALSPCDWSCYEGTAALNQLPVIMPIRGCPYSCTYCFNKGMRNLFKGKGNYIRHHSPRRAVDEALSAIKIFTDGPVIIQSDTIGIDIDWTREFFELFEKEVNRPFIALLRPELARQELVDILKTHNCHSIALGVESGSERIRYNVLNRRYSNQLLLDVAERLHKAGIRFRTYNILGVPTETEAEIWETININIQMKADWPRPAIFIPMPKTQLTEFAIEEKYLDKMDFDDIPDNVNVMSPTMLKKFNVNRIQMLYYFFQTAILFPRSHNIIRFLVGRTPNFLYELWFKGIYALLHRSSEGRGWLDYIRYVWNNRQYTTSTIHKRKPN